MRQSYFKTPRTMAETSFRTGYPSGRTKRRDGAWLLASTHLAAFLIGAVLSFALLLGVL